MRASIEAARTPVLTDPPRTERDAGAGMPMPLQDDGGFLREGRREGLEEKEWSYDHEAFPNYAFQAQSH